MWDARYAAEGFLFGTEPADFLVAQAPHVPPGSKVLCVADGEGRNSVYLAGLGHTVTAFDLRARMFAWMARAVRPGGVLLLHGYAPRQVDYGTGGPPYAENMYTENMLRDAFAGWDILHIADYDADIDEGPGHSGLSGLVDFVARKPGP